MTKSLYLFVTSDRPDQYLNPILHCLQDENPSEVVFLGVKNRPGNDISSSAKLVRENVELLLSSLASGKYKYFTGIKKGKEDDLQKYYPLDRLATPCPSPRRTSICTSTASTRFSTARAGSAPLSTARPTWACPRWGSPTTVRWRAQSS